MLKPSFLFFFAIFSFFLLIVYMMNCDCLIILRLFFISPFFSTSFAIRLISSTSVATQPSAWPFDIELSVFSVWFVCSCWLS